MSKLHQLVSEGNPCDVGGYLNSLEKSQVKREINSYYNGDTPIHIAAWEGSMPITRILMQHGADLEAKNSFGDTPLREIESTLSEMGDGEDKDRYERLHQYLTLRKHLRKHLRTQKKA